MRRLRPGWNVVVVAAAVLAVGLLLRSWVGAQADAAVVLATTLELPVLGRAAAAATGEPRVEDTVVAGTPALVVRPAGSGPWPAFVFVNGATRHGRHHPTVGRLAEGLARAGFLVVVHDPPGLRRGEITERTLESTIAVARAVAERNRLVGFLGVSVGASLALVAASEPELAGDVTVVAGLAPYADLRTVIRIASTGGPVEPFLRLVVARSLAGSLPPGRDRTRLRAHLATVPWESRAPLASLRRDPPEELGPAGSSVVRLLLNRDLRRFDELYAALPARLRAAVRRLSPLPVADELQARVELASAPRDRYFPLSESQALVGAAPDARLTVTGTLEHAVPRASPLGILDLARLDGFAVRVLREASLH
jgi:pimeloyl-ACP methyl ester carboxylesterase